MIARVPLTQPPLGRGVGFPNRFLTRPVVDTGGRAGG